jgi:hypothetical protein
LTIGEAGRVIEQLDADKAARSAGEQALLDELIREFDATPVEPKPTAETPDNEFPPGF